MEKNYLDLEGLSVFLTFLYSSMVKKETEWEVINPILKQGELAISIDQNNKYKVGDGTSEWKSLPYSKAFLELSDLNSVLGFSLRKISSGSELPDDSEGNEGDIFLLRES